LFKQIPETTLTSREPLGFGTVGAVGTHDRGGSGDGAVGGALARRPEHAV